MCDSVKTGLGVNLFSMLSGFLRAFTLAMLSAAQLVLFAHAFNFCNSDPDY